MKLQSLQLTVIMTVSVSLMSCFGFDKEEYTRGMESYNDHDYMDLGLSVNWATCNIKANNPGDCGEYSEWCKVLDVNGNASNPYAYFTTKDAASYYWGGNWRMPTKEEFEELLTNCTWKWTEYERSGQKGYKVTSNVPGYTDRSIFIPAGGWIHSGNLSNQNSRGYYWSIDRSSGNGNMIWGLFFSSKECNVDVSLSNTTDAINL